MGASQLLLPTCLSAAAPGGQRAGNRTCVPPALLPWSHRSPGGIMLRVASAWAHRGSWGVVPASASFPGDPGSDLPGDPLLGHSQEPEGRDW